MSCRERGHPGGHRPWMAGWVWGSCLPGERGSRVCDGHSSASSGGAQGPARALTSIVMESSQKEKSSLLPW